MDPEFEKGKIVTAAGQELDAIVFSLSGQISALALGPGVEFPDFGRLIDPIGDDVADMVAAWEERDRAIRRFLGLPAA